MNLTQPDSAHDTWKPWFAWRPVFLTDGPQRGRLVWLHTIQRERTSWKYPWEYKA